jgi:hypothetical protein
MKVSSRPVVNGFIARSLKPARGTITLPSIPNTQPTFEMVQKLHERIATLQAEKLALENLNAALAARNEKILSQRAP